MSNAATQSDVYTVMGQNAGCSIMEHFSGARGRANAWDYAATVAGRLDTELRHGIGGALVRVLKNGIQVWSILPSCPGWGALAARADGSVL